MSEDRASAVAEWKSNWPLVLASSVGFSFFAIMIGAAGIFMAPLAKEFHWSRTELSAGPAIATLLTALLSPFFGTVIDRFGSRRLVLPGLVITMASIAAFGIANGSWYQWMALWATFGIVSGSIKSTAWTAAVLGVFKASRGLALGLVLCGTALTHIAINPLSNWLIVNFGWRGAFFWLSAGWGGITFLLCLFFLFDAREQAARKTKATGVAAPAAVDLPGLTRMQALGDWALWRVAISNFVVMVVTQGLTIHLIPVLTDAGVSTTNAAWLSSLAGIAGIAGNLATGQLLDRLRPNWVGGITLGAASLAFFLLVDGLRSPTLVVIAMLVNGYAFGTKTQITGFLTSSYAGMKNFGVIYGVMAALMALAASVGPLLAGMIFDHYHNYGPFLLAGGIGCAIGGVIMISMPAYPKWKDAAEAAAAGAEPLLA